jgi:hypothetical protein
MEDKSLNKLLDLAIDCYLEANKGIVINKKKWYQFWKEDKEDVKIENYIGTMRFICKQMIDTLLEKDSKLTIEVIGLQFSNKDIKKQLKIDK